MASTISQASNEVSKASSKASKKLMARHPLQRFDAPSRGASAILHVLGLTSFLASFNYLNMFPTHVNDSYGWHWQFLTIIGLSISLASFAFGLAADLTLNPRLFLIKNALSVCSAPLEVLISLLYWGLSAIDRTLVVPPDVDLALLPDLGFHAAPAILLAIDLLFFSPPWTIYALPAMGLSSVTAFLYWAWIEHCYSKNGWYPYPLFDALDTTQRAMLFTASALLMTGSTVMLKWLYRLINGLEGAEKRSTPANIKGE